MFRRDIALAAQAIPPIPIHFSDP